MREQKFRAWDGKKMHYDVIPLFFNEHEGPAIIEHSNKGFMIKTVKALMEYIGRKDGTGKRVYEEDIVLCSLSKTQRYRGVIKFSEGKFFIQAFWYRFRPWGRWDLQEAPLSGKSNTELDIGCDIDKTLGNTYENPELLERK